MGTADSSAHETERIGLPDDISRASMGIVRTKIARRRWKKKDVIRGLVWRAKRE